MSHDTHKGQDYFDQGEAARLKDKPKSSNPYIVGSTEHNAWNDGWMVTDQKLRPDALGPKG
jgi:hypothetical protein